MTPKLVLHYAPGGILALLKTEPCPGQQGPWGIMHSRCCDKDHVIYRIVNITLLTHDDETWCLEQCLLARRAEQLLMGQTDG